MKNFPRPEISTGISDHAVQRVFCRIFGNSLSQNDHSFDWTFGRWKNHIRTALCISDANKTISLMAPAEEVYQRRNHLTEMSLADYSRYNYSEARKKIFADWTITLHISGLTQEESVETLKEAVQSLRLQTYREGEYIDKRRFYETGAIIKKYCL
jgi:hypothetical protein